MRVGGLPVWFVETAERSAYYSLQEILWKQEKKQDFGGYIVMLYFFCMFSNIILIEGWVSCSWKKKYVDNVCLL